MIINFPRLPSTSVKAMFLTDRYMKIKNVVQEMQIADIEIAELDKVNLFTVSDCGGCCSLSSRKIGKFKYHKF